jgi:hypothetical protein
LLKVRGQTVVVSGNAQVSPAPITLDGDWSFALLPTMDNRWGDFRLPVTELTIGPEARLFRYAEETAKPAGWESPHAGDTHWPVVTYGFGPKFWKLGPLPADADLTEFERKLASVRQIDATQAVFLQGRSYTWQPYYFSWRWGVEGDPGHQGWHGLKEEVTDDFLCLGKPTEGHNEILYREEEGGTRYYLWTSAFTTAEGRAAVHVGGFPPTAIYVNGGRVRDAAQGVGLSRGGNPLLLRYDTPGRGHFVLQMEGLPTSKERTPLAMRWYDLAGRVAFDVRPSEEKPTAWYRFTAPPGLRGMTLRVHGTPNVWVDGSRQTVKYVRGDGPGTYRVVLDKSRRRSSLVALRIDQDRGEYGGAALPEPVLLDCGPGITQTGDWSHGSSLECYSGGAWYRKIFTLSRTQARSRIMLDLGHVVATAEVRVNGTHAGILVSPPWRLNISDHVKMGENYIEILVYNTLANHYLTLPTRYRGHSLQSGLVGPVTLEFSTPVQLSLSSTK